MLPLVSLPGWVASRVIKLPPTRACLRLVPQHHASHTSKLPQTYQQPRPSGKLSKADKPQTLHWTLCPPRAFAVWWRKSIGGFQLELGNRKKLFLLIQNSLESITVLPKLPRYGGGNFTGFYNIFLEADCHHHPNDREAVNIGAGATDGKSPASSFALLGLAGFCKPPI